MLVGHCGLNWDGETLVVETTNFPGQTSFQGSSANLKLVERFTRVDADTLVYEFTAEDPETWSQPWTAAVPMTKSEDTMFEYACREGNYGMEGILAGARADDAAAEASGGKCALVAGSIALELRCAEPPAHEPGYDGHADRLTRGPGGLAPSARRPIMRARSSRAPSSSPAPLGWRG